MKFTDGYWHIRSGVMPHYPIHVSDIDVEPDALTVYGSTKRLAHRGDTVNTGLLTVRFSSPMPNIIRVQLEHHKGQRLPGENAGRRRVAVGSLAGGHGIGGLHQS